MTINFPQKIKNVFGGEPYINIGDETCSCFVPVSFHLVKIMKKYPLLYVAIVEGTKCAERGYYAAGILAFSQLLKEFSESEPSERNIVAHDFLEKQPSKKDYESVRAKFDSIARRKLITEFSRWGNKNQDYKMEIMNEWQSLIESHKKV